MTNYDKYVEVFKSTFEIESDPADLEYQGIDNWDSVGHMALIAALEDAFDIMMETDDIIDFNSFKKGMEILSTKYDVQF